jgi:hypothetical protein
MLVFSPCVLLYFQVGAMVARQPSSELCDCVGLGHRFDFSFVPGIGVLSYVQLAHIGYSNEHRLAIAGAYVGCPLSVLSVVAAVVGNGRSRVITWLAGGSLAVVWSIAFFYV